MSTALTAAEQEHTKVQISDRSLKELLHKLGVYNNQLLLDEVTKYLKEYVYMKNPEHYLLLALWIIQTHIYKSFEDIGFLYIYSPEPQSGKTRLLEIIDCLAHNSSGVLTNPTPAVLFRSADDCTFLMDEADAYQNLEDLRAILNAGYHVGGVVKRNEQNNGKSYVMNNFLVFGPKAIAGIGSNILHATTKDRSFMFQMLRQKKEERRNKFRRSAKAEGKSLKDKINQWATDHMDKIKAIYQRDEFPYLDDFQDRTIDISTPLATILETILQDNPMLPEIRNDLIKAIGMTREEQVTPTLDHEVISTLAIMAHENNPLVGTAEELAAMLSPAHPEIGDHEISRILRRFEFKTKSARKPGEYPKKRYSLSYEELNNLVERYLPTLVSEKKEEQKP
jgi:hypothetical protein